MWLGLDSHGCSSPSLRSIPFLGNIKQLPGIRGNFIVTLSIHGITNKAFSMNRRYVIPVPIVDNPNLIPSCVDPGYKEWNISGIKVINHLYEGGTLNHLINWRKSMAYLKSTDFCKSEFF